MQYLRARYYDAATGRFNRLDPFAGNKRNPQSLHKYLYTHADPVNGIDPSGESLLGGLGAAISGMSALSLFATLAGGIFVVGPAISVIAMQGYPWGRTHAECQARLDYINALIREMRSVGSLYASSESSGLATIEYAYPHWNITGRFHENSGRPFPDYNWPKLRKTMELARYYHIGSGGVYVSKWLPAAGFNWPFAFGLMLHENQFFSEDETTIDFYLHEALHGVIPFFGHEHMKANDEPLVSLLDDFKTPTIRHFVYWAMEVKDDGDKSLWEYLQEEAPRSAEHMNDVMANGPGFWEWFWDY